MSRNSLPAVEIWERKRVGAILRAIRKSQGVNLDEVAGWVGKTRPFLANIEAGRKAMPSYMLPLICDRLDVDPIVFAKAGAMTEDAA